MPEALKIRGAQRKRMLAFAEQQRAENPNDTDLWVQYNNHWDINIHYPYADEPDGTDTPAMLAEYSIVAYPCIQTDEGYYDTITHVWVVLKHHPNLDSY